MNAAPDRATLLARFDDIRRFARGGKRAPHQPLLLLYVLARLKHDRQTEVHFNTAETVLRPLIRSYGPWGTEPRLSYPFSRLVNDRLWRLPDTDVLVDAKGNVRETLARERDAVAGFAPEVLAAFAREPELIDLAAVRLLERHFAPSLHEEILEAIGLQLGSIAATARRRGAAFRAAVLEAYLAECCVCGFSLRLADGLIGVDAAHIQWHAHGALTVLEDHRVRVAAALSGTSARELLEGLEGRPLRLPIDGCLLLLPGVGETCFSGRGRGVRRWGWRRRRSCGRWPAWSATRASGFGCW